MYLFYLAETESHEGKRKVEALWPIFKIHNQKSRYIYDLFHRRKAISRGKFNINEYLKYLNNLATIHFFILTMVC